MNPNYGPSIGPVTILPSLPSGRAGCTCAPFGLCNGVPGEAEDCAACLVLDPEAPCLAQVDASCEGCGEPGPDGPTDSNGRDWCRGCADEGEPE